MGNAVAGVINRCARHTSLFPTNSYISSLGSFFAALLDELSSVYVVKKKTTYFVFFLLGMTKTSSVRSVLRLFSLAALVDMDCANRAGLIRASAMVVGVRGKR